MEVKKIYTEDLQIAKALIQRDNMVTRKYFLPTLLPSFQVHIRQLLYGLYRLQGVY